MEWHKDSMVMGNEMWRKLSIGLRATRGWARARGEKALTGLFTNGAATYRKIKDYKLLAS